MAALQRRLERLRRRERVERVFLDRNNPLEQLSREEVRERYRFFPETIVLLLDELNIQNATNRSFPLPPLLTLLVALQFYATGAHLNVIGAVHGVSKASVSRALRRTTEAIGRLVNRYIYMPGREEAEVVFRQTYSIAAFPRVIGLIDCTHIKIKGPTVNENEYVNRKGFHSLNVQMVCDAQFFIRNVVAKWPGSVHDSRIFRESSLCEAFENGALEGHLLGDSGYGCKSYLLTPYLRPATPSQQRYNNALVKTRVLIEQTFGVLKARFPCLRYGLRVKPDKACHIVVACAILHNYGLIHGDILPRDTRQEEMVPADIEDGAAAIPGLRYRDIIANTYF